ncbi:MAG: AMP-binding protein [Kiritimatiellae bacterium]|nr:AMP-binding protein [Kiritimatiellia bacterium]
MLAALLAVLFGLSLMPGREPLCLKFARKVSEGLMPEGAAEYCRKLTWLWFAVCSGVGAINLKVAMGGGSKAWYLMSLVIPALLWAEKRYRDRRFTVVFHTSGSTGGPKTIVKPFEKLAKEVTLHAKRWRDIPVKPTVIATIQPDHMYGKLWRVLLPQFMGWNVEESVVRSPEELVSKMAAAEKVFLVTTPSFLVRFNRYAEAYAVPRNCLEIITSGAMLQPETSRDTKRVFGVEPLQIYGSTETGGVASRRGDGNWEVFAGVKAERTKEGKLQVKSPFSVPRKYVLGDGVEFNADGTFKLLGRLDRLVKINEERVNLAEMEEKVRLAGFGECALTMVQTENGPVLGCMVAGEKVDALTMRKRLKDIFPPGTVPKRFRFVTELPRNPQGKVVAKEVAHAFEV